MFFVSFTCFLRPGSPFSALKSFLVYAVSASMPKNTHTEGQTLNYYFHWIQIIIHAQVIRIYTHSYNHYIAQCNHFLCVLFIWVVEWYWVIGREYFFIVFFPTMSRQSWCFEDKQLQTTTRLKFKMSLTFKVS